MCIELLIKQVNDLMVDAMKWKELASKTDDVEHREAYKRISNMLYACYEEQHTELERMFKHE